MTIKLAYIKERDGLVFLCDKNGKELGQVVPKHPSDEMLLAAGTSDREYTTRNFGAGFPTQQQDAWDHYDAMLSAARVDVSAALVKVPKKVGGTLGPDDFGDGWNACLDELKGK